MPWHLLCWARAVAVKGCACISSCSRAGRLAVLGPTPMSWSGNLPASPMAGGCGGLSRGWQSAGEPGSWLGRAMARAMRLCCCVQGSGSCGRGAAPFGGTLGAARGGQSRAALAWCVALVLSPSGCVWEAQWWAEPHGAEHGREKQPLARAVGQDGPMAGDSGTAALPGRGLAPLGAVEPKPAGGRTCARPSRAPPSPPPPRGCPRPPPPVPCPSPAAVTVCQGWRGGGGGGRRGKDGGRSTPVMLHAHSSSPPESPTWRAPSSSLRRPRLPAVEDARSIACPPGVLTAGTPPGAGWRPAGPEPV